MKKAISIFCCITILLSCMFLFPASALLYDKSDNLAVFSPEFKDAYIIAEKYNINELKLTKNNNNEKINKIKEQISKDDKLTEVVAASNSDKDYIVSATVFVEEKYAKVNGELIVTESKLLSKQEVDKIGEDNFKTLNASPSKSAVIPTDSCERGKLVLLLVCNEKYHKATSSQYEAVGVAQWNKVSYYGSSSDNPAKGEDLIGLYWGGGFASTSLKCEVEYSDATKTNGYLSDGEPNKIRIWSFEDRKVSNPGIYSKQISVSSILTKKTLTGKGNTADLLLKYIHTYTTTDLVPSISISTSPISFSITNTNQQWSLICSIGGYMYY